MKTSLLYLLSIIMVAAGILHFVRPEYYVKIMPPDLPMHWELVYLSGACEILLGLLLLVPRARRAAAWGLIALFIAVFPANVYLYLNPHLVPLPPIMHLLRLPLQGVLILWAYWYAWPVTMQRHPTPHPPMS